MTDLQEAGFKQRTRIADARERLLDIPPIDRTERISLSVADGPTVPDRTRNPFGAVDPRNI